VTNIFDLLLLDHSLQYCTHSGKLALLKAIASLQPIDSQSQMDSIWAFLQSVFHLNVHAL